MSEDRALEVLGLTATPSEQELKRAYLRQVKAHPPERDADGFRQVREAFELLKQGAWRRQLIAASRPEPEPLEPTPAHSLPEPEPEPLEPTPARSLPEPEPEPLEPTPARSLPEQESEPADEEPADEEPADASEPPGPSFPPHIAREVEALNRALAGDDPASAATATIALYGMPLLEEAPVPPPIFALKTFMVLMERGRAKLARELLDAFESYVQTHQDGSTTSSDVAARWKLAREVLATHELDPSLARAVASGLRSGQLYTASDAAESAFHEHGAKLERYMSAKAPTVWGSIAPLIRPARHEAAGSGSGFKLGAWPLGAAALAVFKLAGLLLSTASTPSTPSVYTEPPRIEAYRPRTSSVDSSVPVVGAGELEAAMKRQLNGSWAVVEQAVKIGDCQTVREQWPLYQAAQSGSHPDKKVERSRVGQVLEMCPELKELVEPTP